MLSFAWDFLSRTFEKQPYFAISGSAIVAVAALAFGRKITLRPFNKIKTILKNIININSNNTQITYDNNPNNTDADDIYLAVVTNNVQKLQILLNNPIHNINKIIMISDEAHSFLTLALTKNFPQIALALLDHGADVTQRCTKQHHFGEELISPLELASKNLDVMKRIHHVDKNQIREVGGKALLNCLAYSPNNE